MKSILSLLIALLIISSLHAQDAKKGGMTIDKKGLSIKSKKGGGVELHKHQASVKSSSGKGAEADKQGARTTPKK